MRCLTHHGALLTSAIALASLAAAQGGPPQFEIDTYRELDRVEGAHVTLATFPIRPMALASDEANVVWAINHHDSTVERFDLINTGTPGTQAPTHVIRVPWKPVSIATWTRASANDELIVACRGTWAVVRIDASSGDILGVIQLRPTSAPCGPDDVRLGLMSEPADVVVDDNAGRAFVSCPGADSVIQIDLATGAIVRVFHVSFDFEFRAKAPTFLTLDESTGDVLVAPMLSGNNTTWADGLTTGFAVADLTGAPIPLPDVDLFRIHPFFGTCPSTPGSNGAVVAEPNATNLGSVLFAHKFNPVTQAFWQLRTDAINADTNRQSEPTVVGEFVRQGVTILPPNCAPPTCLPTRVVLDPSTMPGGNASLALGEGLGQPFALDFDESGRGFVAGMLTDNVAVIGSDGSWVDAFALPAAAPPERKIPRGILVSESTSPSTGRLLVYCWGDNTIRQYHYTVSSPTVTAVAESIYQLSNDPTPASQRPGRSIFFNATNSKHRNVSCASCHIDAGTDLLVWNLSNRPGDSLSTGHGYMPLDDKAGMVTQLLVGLERIGPFHWRGERDLVDFNGAFKGLLGGRTLPEYRFDELQEYIFSLSNPANPNQNRDRIVDNSITFPDDVGNPVAHATDGQDSFFEDITFRGMRCNDCHSAPSGTINDVNDEVQGEGRVRLAHRKPSPFHELWKKTQTAVSVKRSSTEDTLERGSAGSGLNHIGENPTLFDFHGIVADAQTRSDITAFVHQWDQGLAPAVHFTQFWTGTQGAGELSYLLAQFDERNCDIVVFGKAAAIAGGFAEARWFLDRHQSPGPNEFVSDNPTNVANRSWAAFQTVAAGEWFVFMGVPVGMGERFAVDFDFDGVLNGNEPTPAARFNPVAPGGGNPGAPSIRAGSISVDWTTARVARVRFETDQPTTADVTCAPLAFSSTVITTAFSKALSKTHSVLLTGLAPSTEIGTWQAWLNSGTAAQPTQVTQNYVFDVNAVDLETLTAPFNPPSANFVTKSFIHPPGFTPTTSPGHRQRLLEHYIEVLDMSAPVATSSTELSFQIAVNVRLKRGATFQQVGPDLKAIGPAAAERAIIGRVFYEKSDGTFEAAPLLATNPGLVEVDAVRLQPISVPADQVWLTVTADPGGPRASFISAAQGGSVKRTDSSGDLTFEVRTQLPSPRPKSVVFVVDAVIDVSCQAYEASILCPSDPIIEMVGSLETLSFDGAAPGYDLSSGGGNIALSQWSFPDSKEARSLVSEPVPQL